MNSQALLRCTHMYGTADCTTVLKEFSISLCGRHMMRRGSKRHGEFFDDGWIEGCRVHSSKQRAKATRAITKIKPGSLAARINTSGQHVNALVTEPISPNDAMRNTHLECCLMLSIQHPASNNRSLTVWVLCQANTAMSVLRLLLSASR